MEVDGGTFYSSLEAPSMECADSRRPSRLRHLRRLAAGLCLAASALAGPGCASVESVNAIPEVPPAASPAPAAPAAPAAVQPVGHTEPATGHAAAVATEVPITLDTLLRIAEQTNPRIANAREKLNESQLSSEMNCRGWLPQLYAGVAYYRHEGGIQDFQGNLVHSSYGSLYPALQLCTELDVRERAFREIDNERKMWQNKAELSQVNNEVLLDAATTYIDLLAARRGESLTRELERYERRLLQRAEKLAKRDAAADALVQALKAALRQRDYTAAQLHQQGDAASAKLVYLLGLPPLTVLVPGDAVFVPIELVDSALSPPQLIDLAMNQGPSVRELQALVNTIQSGIDRSYGPANLLPTLQLQACEGLFAAGPGATLDVDNRFDLCVQVKWNLTALCQAEEQRRLAKSRRDQAQWTLAEARGKLAAGVQEARSSILAGRERVGLAVDQVRHASDSYRLSNRRLEEGLGSISDVLLSIRTLDQSHFNHLQAIRDHNRAQVQLMMYTGGGPAPAKKLDALPSAREEKKEDRTLPPPKPFPPPDH
jgi:outer membrane protein TolC